VSRWGGWKESASQAEGFVREAWSELRRVHWLSWRETRTATAVVLLVVGLVATFLFLVDAVLSRMLRVFLGT
jgi:preprotein translocase SecE subunit